jgi:DNA uptake protein ComE-like DNA-binding protein
MTILRSSFFAALLTASLLFTAAQSIAQSAPTSAPTSAPAAKPAQSIPAQSISEKIAASKDLLDINTATAAQLKALPGMGDEYVRRIIAGRPYTAKNQLVQRGILPQSAYEQIKLQIIAHRPKP